MTADLDDDPGLSNGRHRRRPPRGVDVLAVLFLGIGALAAIGGLSWQAVVGGSETATSSLSMIATGAIGALAAILSRTATRSTAPTAPTTTATSASQPPAQQSPRPVPVDARHAPADTTTDR